MRVARRAALAALSAEVVGCRRCPRLVAWRELVARQKVARFADQEYWGRPVSGWGDPLAKVLIVGLAPAAHGGNRTGRIFTGDRSGDVLFAALHRAGFASRPVSVARDDGLLLRDLYLAAVNRCCPPRNRPTPEERDRCLPYLVREMAILGDLRVLVALGAFAWDGALRAAAALGHAARPRPRFGHGSEAAVGPYVLLGSFHPSQQNTFTGRLTTAMLDAILARARDLAGLSASGWRPKGPQDDGARVGRPAKQVPGAVGSPRRRRPGPAGDVLRRATEVRLMPQREIELILMRQLASYLATPIFVVEPNGSLLYYNEPAEALLGLRFDEAGEMSFEEWATVFAPAEEDGSPIPPEKIPLAVAFREHCPAHRILRITGLDGVSRLIEVTAFPLEGQGGRHLGAVAIFWAVDRR